MKLEPYDRVIASLRAGKPVAIRYKARNLVVLLTPGQSCGFSRDVLFISGVGVGSEIVFTRNIKLTPMIRVGLNTTAAKALREHLRRVYQNGSTAKGV